MPDLMTNAPCGFVAFRDDGRIHEVNQTLTDMLGYARTELLGEHMDTILPPGGRIFYQTYLFPLLKVQEMVEETYVALKTKSGDAVAVLLNGRRRERDGQFVSECVVMRMTQRHAFEEQLLEARRLAEEASAAKTKFLSMMSHDLRTPLTTIDGNAQLLATGVQGPLTAEQFESVDAIREACRLQTTMISDILEFAQLQSGKVQVRIQRVEVSEAFARAHALVRSHLKESGLRFASHSDGDDIAVMADPNRLQQILLNLLTNAIKFTPAGGEITIGWTRHQERVKIMLRDTGIGIPPEELEKIFSPFVQVGTRGTKTSASSHGVGLGLAICRDLARAMNGEVTAESVVGSGSLFTLELPAAVTPDSNVATSEG